VRRRDREYEMQKFVKTTRALKSREEWKVSDGWFVLLLQGEINKLAYHTCNNQPTVEIRLQNISVKLKQVYYCKTHIS
jgi:hypothetical protein